MAFCIRILFLRRIRIRLNLQCLVRTNSDCTMNFQKARAQSLWSSTSRNLCDYLLQLNLFLHKGICL
ncbi:hypothetical protein L1887_24870 [Cichorium endivia]|nr:hypothetical protein L1887_24870 [Cichorium endivia]